MFNFDDSRDFPFYNENPRMSKIGWAVLLICVPVSLVAYQQVNSYANEIVAGIVFLLIMLVPLLYFSNWDYSLFFKRPSKDELILAVLMFLGFFLHIH